MRMLIAIVCPPLAVLLCGRILFAIFVVLPFTVLFWIPGMIIAMLAVSRHYSDVRIQKMTKTLSSEMRRGTQEQIRTQKEMLRATREQSRIQIELSRAQSQSLGDILKHQSITPAASPEPSSMPNPDAGDNPPQLIISAEDTDEPISIPKLPLIDWSTLRPSLLEAWEMAKEQYHALPDWGQPILWGLGLACPALLALFIIRILL